MEIKNDSIHLVNRQDNQLWCFQGQHHDFVNFSSTDAAMFIPYEHTHIHIRHGNLSAHNIVSSRLSQIKLPKFYEIDES